MFVEDSLLTAGEKLVLSLKQLYSSYGYKAYRMSKFEEYDLYAGNKDFLVSDNVITFTDTNGKLMALKPDVTLSIIKNSRDLPEDTQKVFYNENVYRSDKDAGVFREILQTGLECFGKVSKEDMIEVISLAIKSLKLVSENSVLCLSDLSLLQSAFGGFDLSNKARAEVFRALSERNTDELGKVFAEYDIPRICQDLLRQLLSCHGKLKEVLPELKQILSDNRISSDFTDILNTLAENEDADMIRIDFSLIDDVNYYNGIIFKGYVNGLPEAVISGGQYDNLMHKMNRHCRAIGFAVYTGLIEREELNVSRDMYLNIALPKGRLGEKVYRLFEEAGYECPDILEDNRKLIFENKEKKVRYFWVKPADVAVYVERGAADIGVVGKDILLESEPSIYELLDLKTGVCKMAVAGAKGYHDDQSRSIRVATKFPKIAAAYYRSLGRDIDIIKLNGSIEIAPLLGLSDVIVDIVETGRTLKENDLEVKETIMPISARLIANRSSFVFETEMINGVLKKLEGIVG